MPLSQDVHVSSSPSPHESGNKHFEGNYIVFVLYHSTKTIAIIRANIQFTYARKKNEWSLFFVYFKAYEEEFYFKKNYLEKYRLTFSSLYHCIFNELSFYITGRGQVPLCQLLWAQLLDNDPRSEMGTVKIMRNNFDQMHCDYQSSSPRKYLWINFMNNSFWLLLLAVNENHEMIYNGLICYDFVYFLYPVFILALNSTSSFTMRKKM